MKVETEIYGLFGKADKSILKLNSIIEDEKFQAISMSRADFILKTRKLDKRGRFSIDYIENVDTNSTQQIYLLKYSEVTYIEIEEDKFLYYGFKIISESTKESEFFEKIESLNRSFVGSKAGAFDFLGVFSLIKHSGHQIERIENKMSYGFKKRTSVKSKDLKRLKLIRYGSISEAENKYRKAIEGIYNRKEFRINLKASFDLLPSGLERFYDVEEFQVLLNRKSLIGLYDRPAISDYLARGFLYLGIKDYEKAFENLSEAIKFDSLDDLPYLLRSMIPNTLNTNISRDIGFAYILRPSARSLFLRFLFLSNSLHRNFKEIELPKDSMSLEYYPCSENSQFLRLREHLLERILEIVPEPIIFLIAAKYGASTNERAYIENSYGLDPGCIYAMKLLGEILPYGKIKKLKVLLELKDKGIYMPIMIGDCYFLEGNYKAALRNYKAASIEDLAKNEVEFENFSSKRVVRAIMDEDYRPMGIFYYFLEDDFTTPLNYLKCLVLEENPDFVSGKGNLVYDRLVKIRESYETKKFKINSLKNESFNKTIKLLEITEEENNANKLMVYSLNSKIGFGRYKGMKIYEILEEDPGYIISNIIDLIHFSVHPYVFLDERLMNNAQFLNALEVNLVKVNVLADGPYRLREW